MKNKIVRLVAEKHLENFESMLKDLYKNEILTDVTIHCKDGSVKAHRLVLASCSPYFRKVFIEHSEQHAVFIMHGFTFKQVQLLLELIYKGSIDISSDLLNSVYEVAVDLEVEGITSSMENEKLNSHGRDTRFKGQKRVIVDFKETIDCGESPARTCKTPSEKSSSNSSTENSPIKVSQENSFGIKMEPDLKHNIPVFVGHQIVHSNVSAPKKPTVWALKQRKYKCELCPSSFKRASHLTRHQLVHTGERPYACTQCDKAFSRHDKLKHHIRKAHLLVALNEDLPDDSPYTIGHVQILSPDSSMNDDMEESPGVIRREDLLPPAARIPQRRVSPIRPATPLTANPLSANPLTTPFSPPQKKGRGRPRKYPPVPPPLVKRPRGRPRLNPIVPPEPIKRPSENYDITNMPYGDLEYLTKAYHDEIQESNSSQMENLMEPYVEIKTEPPEKNSDENVNSDCSNNGASFLENIGLLENSAIGKIGECTISVANNSGT